MAEHNKMKVTEWLGHALTGLFTFTGFATAMVGIIELEPIVLMAAGLPQLAGGIFGFRHFRKQYHERVEHETESKLLELFALYKQNLSIAQVALLTKMPTDQIQDQMEKLQKKGVVEINTTETGAVVYQIPQLGANQHEQDWLLR